MSADRRFAEYKGIGILFCPYAAFLLMPSKVVGVAANHRLLWWWNCYIASTVYYGEIKAEAT